jgi:hypothetical protein
LYGGLDLHARTLDVGVVSRDGEVLFHRPLHAAPAPWRKAIAPDREDVGVSVACLFPWSWLADLCAQEGRPFVLGHARARQAIPGGKAQHAMRDAHKRAVLRRAGLRPQASVSPAKRRARRDLLRRRMPRTRQRAALLAQSQQTNPQSHLPAIHQQLAYQANRAGVAVRLPDPAVQPSSAVARTLSDASDRRPTHLARDLVTTATAHEAQPFAQRRSIPSLGPLWALVLLEALPASRRVPRGQDVVSYGRLVQWAHAAAGQASRTGAVAAAAVRWWRHNPAGQQDLARLERQHGQGTALTILTHQLARAVSDRLQRATALEGDTCLREAWRRAGEPAASRAATGSSLALACW